MASFRTGRVDGLGNEWLPTHRSPPEGAQIPPGGLAGLCAATTHGGQPRTPRSRISQPGTVRASRILDPHTDCGERRPVHGAVRLAGLRLCPFIQPGPPSNLWRTILLGTRSDRGQSSEASTDGFTPTARQLRHRTRTRDRSSWCCPSTRRPRTPRGRFASRSRSRPRRRGARRKPDAAPRPRGGGTSRARSPACPSGCDPPHLGHRPCGQQPARRWPDRR